MAARLAILTVRELRLFIAGFGRATPPALSAALRYNLCQVLHPRMTMA